MQTDRTRALTVFASGIVGAVCFYLGTRLAGSGPVPPPATSTAERSTDTRPTGDLAAELRSVAEMQAELHAAILRIEARIDPLGHETEGRNEDRVPAPTLEPALSTRSSPPPLTPNLPIASEVDAQRLSALPRTPTDKVAVDRCLANWKQEEPLLAYATIEDVVARFGFPSRISVDDDTIVWEFKASNSAEGRARSLLLRVVRSRVVSALHMHW